MTAQEIVDSFKHERARFRRIRTDMGECISLWMAGLPIFLWDNMRAHISAYLDRVDPKRQTITDEQLRDAIPNDFQAARKISGLAKRTRFRTYTRTGPWFVVSIVSGRRIVFSDTFELTQPDRAALIHDLRVATTHFDDEAVRATTAGMAEVAGVLMQQPAEAQEIADRLEDARYVRVGRVKV